MYQFYPKNVYDEYGVSFDEVSSNMDEWYDKLVANPNIRRKQVDAEGILDTIATMQSESGYPYIMFIDNVNSVNTHPIKVKFSNLCSEILQASTLSEYNGYDKQGENKVGYDISCNLASGNITAMMEHNTIKETVRNAVKIMTAVSDKTSLTQVPGVYKGNHEMHSIGLGMMNLHGFLAKNYIPYGSEESKDFVDVFFNMVNYYSLLESSKYAEERGEVYAGYENSTYATGEYFKGRGAIYPKTDDIKRIFEQHQIYIPSEEDWDNLKERVKKFGLYHAYRLAVAPNGSTSYIMSATASVTPIRTVVEDRTYGNSSTYYVMPNAEELLFMYENEKAFDLDKRDVIDVIATIQKHVDQGISFELCVNSDITTRDLKELYLYAWKRGIKTLYYTRTNKIELAECESCVV